MARIPEIVLHPWEEGDTLTRMLSENRPPMGFIGETIGSGRDVRSEVIVFVPPRSIQPGDEILIHATAGLYILKGPDSERTEAFETHAVTPQQSRRIKRRLKDYYQKHPQL